MQKWPTPSSSVKVALRRLPVSGSLDDSAGDVFVEFAEHFGLFEARPGGESQHSVRLEPGVAKSTECRQELLLRLRVELVQLR